MSLFSDLLGGGSKNQDSIQRTEALPPIQLPDYAEATGARQNWWDTLQKWGSQPGYGAIAPNWEDIWKNAAGKVQRYFMGGPEGPGAVGTVRANLARRGMSENPAAETQISRLGMQQGNVLGDMATQQATQEAAFGERGRETWLNSIMQLAGLKPSFMSGGSVVNTQYKPESDSEILGGARASILAGELGSGGGYGLDPVMSMFSGSGLSPFDVQSLMGGDTGIGDIGGGGGFGGGGGGGLFGYFDGDESFGQNSKDVFTDPQTYQQIAQIMAMFCWVAAAVFPGGWNDPKTHHARHFIGEIGPKWFKDFYIKHGEKIADFIGDKPILRAVIRPLFETFAFFGKSDLALRGCLNG